MGSVDPVFIDFAASFMEQFTWGDPDVRRAREKSLARSLELTAQAEVSDLRAAEARRIVSEDAMARNL